MGLSLDLDVVDAFRAVARQIANYLYNVDIPGNYFRADALNANLPAYAVEDKLRCFCTSYHSQIIFSEIEPSKILSIDVDAPIKFNEHETELSLKTWHNAGGDPIPRTWKIEEEEKVTESRDIITEISSAIRAKVGGKSPVFEASLEAEISAKLGLNLKRQTERRILKAENLDIVIPGWTSTSLTQRQSIADVKQVIRMRCLVDAHISFVSDGEWGRWAKHFTSFRELENYMRGGGGGEDENSDPINAFVNTRKFQDFKVESERLELEIERERLSRNVKTGEVTKKDIPIENPNPQKKRRRKRRKKGGE